MDDQALSNYSGFDDHDLVANRNEEWSEKTEAEIGSGAWRG